MKPIKKQRKFGKGVYICKNEEEAVSAIKAMMIEKKFGDAGKIILVEEKLIGEEVSFLAFCDGKTVKPLLAAQDHKRAYDGDNGPNTGGMGSYACENHLLPFLKKSDVEKAMKGHVIEEAVLVGTYKR